MNINAVLAYLVKMSPQQRSQFAEDNSDDPLMLSAAKYVDNQIKDQAQALLAQQNGAPPKVNQQVVASMAPPQQQPQPQGQPQPQQAQAPQQQAPQQQAPQQQAPQPRPQQMAQTTLPENSGIAQLPAPNIQKMAGGGIVAFGQGGDVPRPQAYGTMSAGFMPYAPYSPGGSKHNLLPDTTGYEGMGILEFIQKFGIDAYNKIKNAIPGEGTEERLARQKREVYEASPQGRQEKAMAEVNKPTPVDSMTLPPRPLGPLSAGASLAAASYDPATATRRDQYATPTGAPRAPSTRGAVKETTPDIQQLYNSLMPKGPVADPYATENAQNAADRNAIGQGKLDVAKEREQGLAGLLASRESRIAGREERIQKTEDMSTKMAVINAGLAMMQSTGKGLAGIAEGAGVGVKQYGEGKKLSEAARQKIEDAKDAFDELRFNQTNMSKKEIADGKAAIKEAAIISRNEGIASVQKATGDKRADAAKVFDATLTTQESARDRASRERAAAFSAQVQKEIASMPGAQEKLFATLGGGDAKKGFDYFNTQTAEGKGDQAILQGFIKNPAMMEFLDPSTRTIIQQMLKAQLAPKMVSGDPAAGQVRAP
jgi:hypothetical protein